MGVDYSTTDIGPRGFTLYSSKTYYYSSDAPVLLASVPGVNPVTVTGANNVCFNVSLPLALNQSQYIFLGIDVDPNAENGKSFRVYNPAAYTFTGSPLVYNSATGNSYITTITTTTGTGNLMNWLGISPTTIAGGNEVKIASIYSSIGTSSVYKLNQFVLSLTGTFSPSDLDYIRIEANDGYWGARRTIASLAGANLNTGLVTFTGLYPNSLDYLYNLYFEVFAKLSASPQNGNTIKLGNILSSDIRLQGVSFTGSSVSTPQITFGQPNIAISKENVPSATIYSGDKGNVYKLVITNTGAGTMLNRLRFTVSGNNLTSTFSTLRARINSDNHPTNGNYSSVYAYLNDIGGGKYTAEFTDAQLYLEPNKISYLLIENSDLSFKTTAYEGTFKVDRVTLPSNAFTGYTFSGFAGTAGNTMTLKNTSYTLSRSNLGGNKVVVDDYMPIYSFKIKGFGPPYINMYFTTTGTYLDTDIDRFRIYSSEDEVFDINEDSYQHVIYNNGTKAYAVYGLGWKITNPDLTYFICVAPDEDAVLGRTIQVSNFSFDQSNGLGTFQNFTAGNTYTIAKSKVTVSDAPSSNSRIINPEETSLIKTVKLSVENGRAYINNFRFRFEGNFTNAHINHTRCILTEQATFNPNTLNALSEAYVYGPSPNTDYAYTINSYLDAGKEYYLHLVAYSNSGTTPFNKYIGVSTVPSMLFATNVTVTNLLGTFGETYTITSKLNVSNNTTPVYEDFATNNNARVLCGSYKLQANNSSASFTSLRLKVETDLSLSELTGIKLFYSSPSRDASLTNISEQPTSLTILTTSGGYLVTLSGFSLPLSQSNPHHYFLMAMVNTSSAGKTLRTHLIPDNGVIYNGVISSEVATITSPLVSSVAPIVTITTMDVPGGVLVPVANVDQLIYKLKVVANAAAKLDRMVLSLSGTYTNSDLDRIRIMESLDDENFTNNHFAEAVSVKTTTTAGESITLNFGGSNVFVGKTPKYLYITARMYTTTNLGRNLKVHSIPQLTTSGVVTVDQTNRGNEFLIGQPVVNASIYYYPSHSTGTLCYFPVAMITLTGTNSVVILSSVGLSLRTFGTYTNSHVTLYARTMTEPNDSLNSNIYPAVQSLSNMSTTTSYNMYNDYKFSRGTRYIFIYASMTNTFSKCTFALSVGGFNLAFGTVAGFSGQSGDWVFDQNSLYVKPLNLPASRTLAGRENQVIGAYSVSVSGSHFFVYNIDTKTKGIYTSSDIKEKTFKVWVSNSSQFSTTTATYLAKATANEVFGAFESVSTPNIFKFLAPGMHYIFFTADIKPGATHNSKIGIKDANNKFFKNYSVLTTAYSIENGEDNPELTIWQRQNQSVSFNNNTPTVVTVTSIPTTLSISASATSSLNVELSVVSGPASVSSNSLSITGVGDITLKASQAGNDFYYPATDVTATITIVTVASPVLVNPTVSGVSSYMAQGVTVYPTLFEEVVHIATPHKGYHVVVTNSMGKTIFAQASSPSSIKLSGVASGVYTLKIVFADGSIHTGKLVKY